MKDNEMYKKYHRKHDFVYKEALPYILPVLASNYPAVVQKNGRHVRQSQQHKSVHSSSTQTGRMCVCACMAAKDCLESGHDPSTPPEVWEVTLFTHTC